MENTKDRFYVDLQNVTIEWMYYNPDSDSGGQFVLFNFVPICLFYADVLPR